MNASTSATAGQDAFGEGLLTVLAAVGRHVRRRAGRPAAFAQLTGAQLELLRLLRRRPGISVAEAASDLRVAPNTVSTLVRQLTRSGHVSRRTDTADRRVAQLELTPDLLHTFDAFRDRRLVTLTAGLASLCPEDRRALETALPALVRLAETLRDPGPGAKAAE